MKALMVPYFVLKLIETIMKLGLSLLYLTGNSRLLIHILIHIFGVKCVEIFRLSFAVLD